MQSLKKKINTFRNKERKIERTTDIMNGIW